MIDFLTLQTNANERRKVSIGYSDKNPETCVLLGGLEHHTEFKRADLVTFARAVIESFAIEQNCVHCGALDGAHYMYCQELGAEERRDFVFWEIGLQ